MWIWSGKHSVRLRSQIIRQVSNFADDLGEGLIEAKRRFMNDERNKPNARSLKIAIVGLPNVGKSTLVNCLTSRTVSDQSMIFGNTTQYRLRNNLHCYLFLTPQVCATSKKIHTTRNKAAAIFTLDETQLIFLDTPGLVAKSAFKRFQLEDSFKHDAKKCMEEADVVGVVQDVSNTKARESIHGHITDLLEFSKPETNSVLILNKVDCLKNKRVLLQVVNNLTKKEGLPKFSDVFMISALTGDGVDDLRVSFYTL